MPYNIEDTLPEGFTKFDPKNQQSTVFDYEAIEQDDDKELWLIRVPEEISEQNLTSMQIKMSKTAGKPLSRLQLDEKDMYSLYRVPQDKSLDSDVAISGQEMLGLSCMVPSRNQKGKLVFAPKEISNYFILDEEVTVPDGTALAESIRDKPVVKRQHPEGLQMRFKPYGFDTCEPTDLDQLTKKVKKDDDDSHTDKKRKKVKTDEDKKKKKKEKK
ncbi:DNA-directed RNA polymerase I, subunit RPA34.5 [Chlamydoabsidia padenii]|nr:DNA-directed RNA polymerase I, subunit RPA34.5 [Chlamydoabsidia padenii]